MTPPINESGMTFGPYPIDNCFYIEKSELYKKLRNGVPMAEFLLIRSKANNSPQVWVVEAKSSSPQPITQPNFDKFIGEIREKLINALSLSIAACLKRHPGAEIELPASFKTLDLAKATFRLVLVINEHQESWLPPLQDALNNALHSTVKTWGLPANAVVVINDTMAKEHGLIV